MEEGDGLEEPNGGNEAIMGEAAGDAEGKLKISTIVTSASGTIQGFCIYFYIRYVD